MTKLKRALKKGWKMIKCELKDIVVSLQEISKFCADLYRKIKKLKTASDDDVNAMAALAYIVDDYLTKIDDRVDEINARDT